MSMYKTIFWSDEYADLSTDQSIQLTNGDALVFGESAFSTLDEAVAAAGSNAIVIKVASGKYDSFTVINEGVTMTDVNVVAVDFNGGEIMVDGKAVTVADSGIAADAQASIIADLNDINAADGKIFVAADLAPESATTLYVGMGEAGYVAGAAATVVTGKDFDEIAGVIGGMYQIVEAAAATEVTSGQNVYFDKNTSGAYVFEAGSVAHNELSKWDMTYAVTIKGGASLVAGRNNAAAIAANTPQTSHIKSALTLDGTADNKAVLNFLSDTRQDASLAILYNGKLNATHADIYVADLGFTGKADMTDCKVYVDGVVAFGKNIFYKQTMTNTTMEVRGHNRHNENTYFSTEGIILNNLTMTNSSITVNDGVDSTTTEKVTIKKLTMISGSSVVTEGALEITGTLTIDSSCTLTMDSLAFGNSGKITLNLLDGFTGGKIIDITGATGLTDDILSKITLKGANEGFGLTIQEGDIYVMKGAGIKDGNLDLTENESETFTGTIGKTDEDLAINASGNEVTDSAEIKADVVGNDITLNNSKELAVTGSIKAEGTATISNSGTNIYDEEGKLVAEATFNGGYADGEEKAAKVEAEKIVMQNDGHANVEFNAKTIIIANNSKETLTGNIGTADTENVIIADGTATADDVLVDGNGEVDGAINNATITAQHIQIAGQAVSDSTLNGRTAIAANSSLDNTKVNGVVSVGFDAENAADTTLTLAGDTDITSLYVGKEGRENDYKLSISGENTEVTLGSLYNRTDSVVEFTDGATANIGYWQSKGSVLIDDATVNHTGVNMYVYNNDSTSVAEIKLTNGATLNSDANYAIYLGNNENGPARGNAKITLESGSTLNTKNLTLHAEGTVEEVADAAAQTSVSVTDSTLNVSGTLTNNGTVTIGGESELNIAAAAGKAVDFADGAVITSTTGANFSDATHYIGGVTFGSGKFNFAGSAMAYDKLALNAGADVTAAQTFAVYDDATIADGASVSANSVYLNGGNVTLAGDLTAKGNDGGLLLRNSNKSFNVDGGNVDVAYIEGTRGTVSVNLTNATVKGGHHITDNGGTLNWNIDNSSVSARTWTGAGDIKVNDGEITVTETLTNNGTFTVSGESTLNIAAVAAGSNDIELSEGTILKDSTIMGDVGITGNVTFRGKNVLNNLYDFGEYGAYGNTDWAKWTVEAGSQLFLEQSVTDLGNNLYGVGYGDTVVINGNLTDADAARAAGLTKDDASFYSRTGVRFSSGAGWATSSFTVNNAYVILGTDGSFSNSASNGGSHEITFNNAVVDAAQFYFSESAATFDMSITDSNINAVIFMTADTDSVYTLTGSKVVTTGSGNDRYNGNAGALTITDSEITVQTGSYKNSGTITFTDSTLTAASVANTGTISLTVTADKLAAIGNDAYYIINQTGSGAALNNTVSIAGTEYSVGQSFTKDGVVYSVTNGDGNDIAIQAAAKILTVNSSYTEDTPGFGFSKFNKFEDALQAASSEATAIKLESDVTVASGIGYYNLPADLSIIADEHVTLDMAGTSFYPMNKKTLVVGENVEITNMGQMIAWESRVILNGDFAGAHLWTYGWNGDAENGATGLTINETSKVKVSEQLEFRGGDVTINGNITDTAVALGDADQIQLLGTTYGAWGGASGYATKVNLNDTYIKLAQNTIGGASTKFQDGSSAIVTMDNSIYETASEGAFNVASTGLVKAENGSIIYINSGVRASNAGTINITDSTFESKSEFTNSGTIAVSGDSTINVAKMTGDNAIQILDGATITESSVNGAVDLVSGTINFAGTNAFTGGMLSAGYYNYGDDLTVNITGDFTADNMVAWGGNDTKTVVNVGSEDARTTYNGGTIGSFYGDTTINITNTDVEYHYIYIQGNLNVSDSTLQIVDNGVNTYFRTGSADHRIAIDNTTWNAGSFTNMGSYDASIAGGSAIVDITGGSTFNSGNFTLTTTEGTDYVVDLTVDNSTLNATTAFNVGAGTSASFENGAVLNAETINNAGTINVTGDSTLKVTGTVTNAGTINVSNSTLEDIKISGVGETGYVRAENAVLSNLTVSGQETYTVNTDFNGGTYTGKVYTGYGLVDGEWARVTDSESTITGTVDASSVHWQNYGKLTIAEGAELKTSYFSEGSRQVLTVDGTISAGTFRGYNGVVSETGKINAQAAVQFYGNPDTKRQYDINGEVVVTHDIAYAHNIVVGFNTAKQWYGDGPNDYWNIGGANTEVNVSGEKAKLQIVAGKAGKGTAIIHVDEEGTKATLNISDKAQFLVDGKVINNGNLNIANNAIAAITGNVANAGTITVDASSSFSAGSIVNNGTFNSANAGEMVVLGDMTVTGNIQTTDLILKAGAALTVGSITVDNLTLAIGSELTLGSGNSTITADYITVTGTLVPENAEFTLVASGWTEALAGKQVWFDANYDGTIDANEKFSVKSTVDTLSGLNFVSIGGNLYVKDFGAATTGIYIGELPANAQNGDKITTPDGATYTVGEDAFATAADAAETLNGNVGNVKSIALDKNDHVNDVAEKFSHISEITIHKGTEIVDTEAAAFSNDLVINNDGHLEANITAKETMEITNTSINTLLGSYSSDETITVNNAGGMIGDAADDATAFNTGHLTVKDGDAVNVEVNAGTLNLFDTNTFGINAESGIFAGDENGAGQIFLNGSANMSIDGEIANTDVVIQGYTGIPGYTDEHTGTLTLNGNQTFSGDISANKIVVANNKVVTFNQNTVDFDELNIAGSLNADFTQMGSFTTAGTLTGNGVLNTTHNGPWIINESVTRDVTGFAGTVTMENAGAEIVLKNEKSYFSDDAEMVINAGQTVTLAKNTAATGIDFSGAGTINVGEYNTALADISAGFTQTLSGNNDSFSGTVNVSEEATLTLQSNIGGNINLDEKADTGNATTLVLDAADLTLTATVKGDANDIIDVAEDATLSEDAALNEFTGKVEIADNKALTLNGQNTTSAEFTGSSTAELNVNANTTLTAANTNFDGTLNIDTAYVQVQLDQDFGKENGNSVIAFNANNTELRIYDEKTVVINSKLESGENVTGENIYNYYSDLTLTADEALNAYDGTVTFASNPTYPGVLTLKGDNTTAATFVSQDTGNNPDGGIVVLDGGDLTLTNSNALLNYKGGVSVGEDTLTFEATSGDFKTAATISGDADAVMNVNSNVTLLGGGMDNMSYNTKDDAITGFSGTINVADNKTLTIDSSNTTAATFVSDSGTIVFASDDKATVNTLTSAGALNDVHGTIKVGTSSKATLTLKGENTTDAKITGGTSAVIDADANQTFSGDVSGFSGLYDIADGSSVTLSGTIANVIKAQGDTLTLSNTTEKEITVNAGTDLDNLNFGYNNVTLGTGDGDDFTNVIGNGNIVDFGQDQTFGTVEAGTINVTGSQDALTIGTLTADINITVDAAQTDDYADVTVNGNFDGNISVNVENGEHLTGGYKLVYNSAFDSSSTIDLTVGSFFKDDLEIDELVVIDGKAYLLQLKDNTLILSKLPGFSNHVVVDEDWSSKVPFQSVDDNGTERIIGYNAASSLNDAVSFIKGRPDGLDWGTDEGDAMIELTEGKYTLPTGTLMTDENGVTQLTLKGRDGQTATITGVIAGSDGRDETTLTLENIHILGDIYGGGKLVVNNTNDVRSTGDILAGGVLNDNMANASSLTINGGYFGQRLMVGGSVNDYTAGSSITVTGSTLVVIENKYTDKMVISSNIYGGSWAATGDVVQYGAAEIQINVANATQIRGNIFVGCGASYGNQYTMEGNSTITFTGKADLLTFTGSVTGNVDALNNTTAEKLIFNNFAGGAFYGNIRGFDTITISGDTSLELGRRQTKTANTELEFVINSETDTSDGAMYIVRDANSWEFAKTINIDVDNAKVGNHVLVDNYTKGFEGFTFTFGEADAVYTLGTAVTVAGKQYTVNASGDSLVLEVVKSYSGTVSGNVSGTSAISNADVSGDVTGTSQTALNVEIGGNTVINGRVVSNAKNDSIEIAEGASVTIKGTASDNFGFFTSAGNDTVNVADDASVVVEGGHINLGAGDDTMVIGENVNVVISAANAKLQGGAGNDNLIVGKGSSITSSKVEDINITMDVDAVLNNTCAPNLNSVNNVKLNVVGVKDLVLNGTDAAGAKSIFANLGSSGHTLKVDDVDMILDASYDAGTKTAGAETPDQRDDLWTNIGEVKQIAGADTTADTSDDVWASLNKIDNNLVVAWGRTEDEVGAALDAFNHYKDNNTDLVLGDAVVSSNLADGFNTTDTLEKKSNGTLA